MTRFRQLVGAWALCAAAACSGGIGEAGGNLPSGACLIEDATEACYPGDPATRGIGACRDGTRECLDGQWTDCDGAVIPVSEECGDDVDDNCNGVADDGCACEPGESRPCYSGPSGTANVGPCRAGLQSCSDGVWAATCDGVVLPAVEVCDAIDNDCNGAPDEGCACVDGATQPCYSGPPDSDGVGVCHAGVLTCSGGQWPAVADCELEVTPGVEICDGYDNDCDGDEDEGNPGGGVGCYSGQPGVCSPGVTACQGGATVCVPSTQPSAEACNGKDDDCDGTVDEGNPGGGAGCNTGAAGVCAWGSTACYGGTVVCVQVLSPSAEKCNGADDDCDGQADEGNPGGGGHCNHPTAEGICKQNAEWLCEGGALKCKKGQPKDEVCNGKDDDCDGKTDEGPQCGPGKECVKGECKKK